jgi:Zn-dependent protease/CBS domain-containing protein
MRRHTILLGRVLGIPIGLDPSWFLIFALVTWTLAASYFPSEFNNWPQAQYWIVGAVTAILFFASVVLHELGHSILALRYKIPVQSITLFIFGGIAQIAAEPPSAVAEFLIAIAGPLTSFALAVIFGLLQQVFTNVAPLLALAEYLAYINGTLALFNLIPGFPLDGGRVFRAIIWSITGNLRRATLIAATVGRLVAALFILVGVWQIFGGNLGNGLWLAFIGWFLENAAVVEVQQQRLHDLLAGHTVSQAMSRSCATAPADLTLQEMVDRHILGSGQRCLVLTRGDETVGLLTLHHIRGVPKDQWAAVTAAQAMTPMSQMKKVQPDVELQTALEDMDRDGVNQLPVMTDGRVLGMLSREDVISYLRTLRELGV